MKIKISADSTCDLTPELKEQYDISVIPLSIIKDGTAYKDGIEITPPDIFAYVESGAGMVGTAAVSPGEYIKTFSGYLETYDAVIHLSLGSGFSSCYQNARVAAGEFSHVYVIDSENLSLGTGVLAVEAAKLAAMGLEPPEIIKKVEAMRPYVDVSFVIDTLAYLHKGGRCSALQLMGANLLNLKPCIEVKSGKMDVGKRYRGQFRKVLPVYIRDRLSGRERVDGGVLYIAAATGVSQEIMDEVRQVAEDCMPFDQIIQARVGCTISCHCGPNTLGILYFRK